ncbi:MAG: hypothetical protein L3J97_00195 [Thermoplasmata archaeon]|nr:hypothetical protein [Thermoplasmata archaeon]
MLSGPDLGGGFLFQLSLDRDDDRNSFTFHSQVGGPDASGPPKGSPEPLGWARSDAMCMFGGRLCWHREFELGAKETAIVRGAYNRTRLVMAGRIDQSLGETEVPFEAGLSEWLDRAVPILSAGSSSWMIGGAAALRLHGVRIPVDRIAVHADEAAVRSLAGGIREYLIEPAAWTRWWNTSLLGARAFVGTPASGVTVEWSAPLTQPDAGEAASEAAWLTTARPPVQVAWKGRSLPIAPLELGLGWAAASGTQAFLETVAEALDPTRIDRELLARVVRDPTWSTELRQRVVAALARKDPSLVEG